MTQFPTNPGGTPWREKPALPDNYPFVYISKNLWHAADKAGYDMRFFKMVEPIPGVTGSGGPTRVLRPGQTPVVPQKPKVL